MSPRARIDLDPTPLPGAFDAHTHTWSTPEFDEDYEATLERAWRAGLVGMVEVGVDTESSDRCLELAARDPRVHAVVGLHPEYADRLAEEREGIARAAAAGAVGIGEIGLDFSRPGPSEAQQVEAFRWQLELARERRLPVVIHARDADEACYAVLEQWYRAVGDYLGPGREVGMMHCYAGDAALAARYLDIGFLISVPGTVTFPNNPRGQEVARSVPLAGMLVETDSPYLTPAPHRGRRNEPAYVVETARFVAGLRGCSPEEVAQATAQNAARLFDLA
ncbi:MAG: TatD family hydrolase [Dehalococcoidia bacterium]